MERRPAVLFRHDEITAREHPYEQRLNPKSRFRGSRLGRDAGLRRVGISRGRIPPGGESFAYHAHLLDDEWIYILEGRAHARIDGQEHELGPGDFVAFPAPQVAHVLANRGDTDVVYLFGGDDHDIDILDYPDLDRRYVLTWDGTRTAFHALGPAEYPFVRLDAAPAKPWRIFGAKGWGNVIVEAGLALAGIPFEREEVDPREPGPALDRLRAANPLLEIPTAVLPDGSVMTESAAILLHLADTVPGAGLAPRPGDPARTQFLRWLTYFVAAIYPTFTYGDVPTRYVTAGDELRTSTNARREQCWRQLETVAAAPYFLGDRLSALDLYVAVMTRWRPGRKWFAEHAPRLAAIAAAVDAHPVLAPIWAANF